MLRHPVYSVVHPAGCLIPCIEAMYGVYRAMKLPIYLDYSATTPVDPRVAEKMMQFLTLDGTFGNPASRSFIRKKASTSSPAKPNTKPCWIPAVSWSAKGLK